jgi:hypothetical protein
MSLFNLDINTLKGFITLQQDPNADGTTLDYSVACPKTVMILTGPINSNSSLDLDIFV